MDEIIRIDGAGRLVIPKGVRRRHHLVPGCRLRVRDEGPRIVLEPIPAEARLEDENGILVIHGHLAAPDFDHRTVRDERIRAFIRGS